MYASALPRKSRSSEICVKLEMWGGTQCEAAQRRKSDWGQLTG